MESFEDLGLEPELVEVLAAEGIELPTALQLHAIPVLRRGNAAVLRGGAGAGVTVAWAAPLLGRVEPAGETPGALVLTPTRETVRHLATSVARLTFATGHRVGAFGIPWALPSHADILIGTPADLLKAIRASEVKLDGIQTLVLDGGGVLLDSDTSPVVEALLEALPGEGVQKVMVAEPITAEVRAFVDARMRKAVFLPPEAGSETGTASPVQRGELRVRTGEQGKDEALVGLVAELLADDLHHVLVFARSEDRAADLGDLLVLHGFATGRPGDPSVPVWLGVDPLEARGEMEEEGSDLAVVGVISADVPADVDSLDRRHSAAKGPGAVLIIPRELPHLLHVSGAAGYTLKHLPAPDTQHDPVARFRAEVEEAVQEGDLAGAILLLDPLVERHGSVRVAAALANLLRRSPKGTAATAREAQADPGSSTPAPPVSFVRLFLSIGSRDGVRPGDLVGAITGETGIDGSHIGKIEMRDTFARVEVAEQVAQQVVRKLNGTSIRGRSVRVDYDRGGRQDAGDRPDTGRDGGRKPGGRGGPPGRGGTPGRGGPGRGGPPRGRD